MKVAVPERGTAPVSAIQWDALAGHDSFWKLVEAGVVTAETNKTGGWQLKGTCYVGRALVGDTVLEVHEKFEGSLQKLLSLGSSRGPLLTDSASPVAPDPYSTPLLISLFIKAARRYLSGHKLVRYVGRPDAGTLVSGRLDVRRTAQLRAKGMLHQAAFTRSEMSADLDVNRVIYAALRQVDFIAGVTPIARHDLASARALSSVLSESFNAVWRLTGEGLHRLTGAAVKQPGLRPVARDAVSLAAAVLDSAGFGGPASWTRTVERSWFVNLEKQFEDAVRDHLKAELAPTRVVTGPKLRPPLFQPDLGRYAANPDVVIESDGSTVAIGDAKYKEYTGWPSSSDVHELLAHAAAYRSKVAFLVFPNEEGFVSQHIGKAATGCDVWSFGITFERFSEDLATASQMMGLIEEGPENLASGK